METTVNSVYSVCGVCIDPEETQELQLFRTLSAKKRPYLTEGQREWLLGVLNRKTLGIGYIININATAPDVFSPLKPRITWLPDEFWVGKGLISCKCKGGKLNGVWPNDIKEGNRCRKQESLLSTLYVALKEAFQEKRIMEIVNGCVIGDHDDACSMNKELSQMYQHATQSE